MPAERLESGPGQGGPLQGSDGETEKKGLLLEVTQRSGSTAGTSILPASAPLTTQRLDGTVDLILGLVCVFSMVNNSKMT